MCSAKHVFNKWIVLCIKKNIWPKMISLSRATLAPGETSINTTTISMVVLGNWDIRRKQNLILSNLELTISISIFTRMPKIAAKHDGLNLKIHIILKVQSVLVAWISTNTNWKIASVVLHVTTIWLTSERSVTRSLNQAVLNGGETKMTPSPLTNRNGTVRLVVCNNNPT